ncbi:MAG: tetratricopeptide repeat protein, partial [Candidatus Omnitrophota bacterium]
LKYSTKNRVASFMLFWALVFFIPQSGLFPINAFVAEHFIYLPAISFFLLIVCFLHKALRNKVFILVVSLLCASYILLTSARNFEWRNPIVFYKNIIKYSPDSFQAHNNLGLQYEYLGRFDEAGLEYKRAIFIKPDLIEAHANLANLYFKLKAYDQAKAEYELLEKTDLGSKAGETQNNLGNIYEALGKPTDALEKYNQALLLDASLKFTHFNLARIYFGKGKIDLAARHILGSLGISEKLEPHKQAVIIDFLKNTYNVDQASEFYNNLGINLAKNNLLKDALNAFNLALELNPRFADCYFNQGLAYLYLGKKSEARFALKQVLKIDPNHIRAKRLIAERLM